MRARDAREATRWVPDAVRIVTFDVDWDSDSDADEGGGEGGLDPSSEAFAKHESLGRCQTAPVLGCFARPNGIWK